MIDGFNWFFGWNDGRNRKIIFKLKRIPGFNFVFSRNKYLMLCNGSNFLDFWNMRWRNTCRQTHDITYDHQYLRNKGSKKNIVKHHLWKIVIKSLFGDSNPRPIHYEWIALPAELKRQYLLTAAKLIKKIEIIAGDEIKIFEVGNFWLYQYPHKTPTQNSDHCGE